PARSPRISEIVVVAEVDEMEIAIELESRGARGTNRGHAGFHPVFVIVRDEQHPPADFPHARCDGTRDGGELSSAWCAEPRAPRECERSGAGVAESFDHHSNVNTI